MELLSTYIDSLKDFEGFRHDAYTPKGEPASDYLTIGYGTRLPRAKAIALSPIDKADATLLLNQSLSNIVKFVRSSLQSVDYPLSDAQFTALVDFCYNCGTGAYQRSTLYKLLSSVRFTAEDLRAHPRDEYVSAKVEAICNEFMRWTRSGGKVLQGLVTRCNWRAYLWRSRAVDALYRK